MGDARPLFKIDADNTVAALKKQLKHERQLRKEAELNSRRFHALLLQARVELIRHRKEAAS